VFLKAYSSSEKYEHTTSLICFTGLNALSGTTYKGAKLRIAEARPDFRER
jgi:hypothetical protein